MKHKERVKGFRGIVRGSSSYLYISALMLLLLFPTNSSAVSWEVDHIMVGVDYQNVATGDFNNDGRQDIIAAGTNGVDVWLQGLYFPCPASIWSYGFYTVTSGMGGSYNDAAVADFNNDGNLDFAAVEAGGIDVWLGDGDQDGDFSMSWLPALTGIAGVAFKSIKAFDYRNDGDMDIIVAGNPGIFVMIGPTFGTSIFTSLSPYNEIALTDFNNDAITDIVAVRDTGVSVWFGNGPPGWVFTAQSGPATTKYISVAAADLDLDGKSDIVAGSEYGISIWYGDGKGSWKSQKEKYPGTTLPTEEDIYQRIAIADVDSDGFPDIIGAQNGGGILVWFGDPDHLWVPQTSVFKSGNYRGISVIDYNIDGLLDVVSASPNSVKVSRQKRETEVKPLQWLRGASGSALDNGYQGVDSADFNRDGIPDVVAAKNDGGVHIWLGKKGGGWVKSVGVSSPAPPTTVGKYYDVTADDFNNDGLMDVAASHNGVEGVKVWLGQFSSTTGTATGGGPSSLVVTGKSWAVDQWVGYQLMITSGTGKGQTRVVERNTSDTLIIYSDWNINPGNGSGYRLSRYFWSSETGPTALENHYHLTAADLDHDGGKDLIAGSDNGVKVWFNDGFTSSSVTWSVNSGPATIGGYNGVAVGDVNEDGDPDIIAGNCEIGGIDVWFGNGDRTWWDAYLETPPVANNYIFGRMIGKGQLTGIPSQLYPATTTSGWSVYVTDDSSPGNEVWEVISWIGSVGYVHGPATTNQFYTSDYGEVSFTITSGTIPFRIGDWFRFRTASGSDGIGPRPERLGQILMMTRLYDGVATGDFDRDGNLDIVAGNAGGWGVQVWFGDGKGEWRLAQVTPPNPMCKNAGTGYITTENSFIDAGSDILTAWIFNDSRWFPPNNVGVKTDGYLTDTFDWVITVKELAKVEDMKKGESNQGDEEVVDILLSCDTVIDEDWTIIINANTSTFTVVGAFSGPQANIGMVDTIYNTDYNEVTFTVTSSTGAKQGDLFTFRTVPCTFTDNQPGRPSEHLGDFGSPYVAYWNDEVAFTLYGDPRVEPSADVYEFTAYYPGITVNGIYYDVAVADLNRDGYEDIIAANKEDGGIQVWTNGGRGVWLKNPGDETLDPWVAEESPINIGNYSGVTIVDFDQDGLLDIVGAHDITSGIGIEVWRQVIDWEPPYVVESSIADGANDVPIESEIIFTFNEEIDHTTLNPETVLVEGSESGELSASLIYSAVDNTLLISPEKDFRVGEKVTVTLRAEIKDLVGNSLDGDGDGVEEGYPIDNYILVFNTKDNIPQGLQATANDVEIYIALSWYPNPESNLGGYNIYRSTDPDAFPYGQKPVDEPFLDSVPAGIENYSDYSATTEVTYYYAITAINDDIVDFNESGFSETASAILLDKIPAAPTTLVATAIGRTNVTLNWDSVTTNEDDTPITDLAGYNLYRSEVSGAGYNFVDFISGPTTTYYDSGLEEGGTYYYVVRALDNNNNESVNSPELQISLLYELAPAAPDNVTLVQIDPITVRVDWDPVTTNEGGSLIVDLAGYRVYRCDDACADCTDFSLINSIPEDETSFYDDDDGAGLVTEGTYCYIVTAVDDYGKESEDSVPVTIVLLDIVPIPENLVAFPISDSYVKLVWEAPEYETPLAGYNIRYSTISPDGPWTKVNFAPIPQTTHLVINLTGCQEYYFKVTAVDEGGVRESELDDCEAVWVRPHIPGDFDCNGVVNQADYDYVFTNLGDVDPVFEVAFGYSYGQPRYRAEADLNQDLRVDGLDLADFARRMQ